jgi:Tol biopolymer transport system component
MEWAVVDPDRGDLRSLGGVPEETRWGFQPHSARLSPDGTRVAFGKAVEADVGGVRHVMSPERIQVCRLTGTGGAEAVIDVPGAGIEQWYWSPDGSKVAFTSWGKGQRARNWSADVRTSEVRELVLPHFRFEDQDYPLTLEGWSPDGEWFLAAGNGLYLVKTDGSTSRKVVPDPNILSGSCRFSPDGRQLLFVSVNQPRMPLLVADLASGTVRILVDRGVTGTQACWSPDGRRIAYCCTDLDEKGNPTGGPSLFVTDVDGTNGKRLLARSRAEEWVVPLDWRAPASRPVNGR